jgi:HTH-type transcriptional regulator, transcriptional repressor of NAD biosynthesis genes
MKRGIVIGKFYPPHLGHKFLIETAEANCDQLTVLICDSPRYSRIPAKLRAKWLKTIHPNCKITIVEDIEDDNDSQAWADYTLEFLGYKPDMVFSSENYGSAYAKCMGTEHVMVDYFRKKVRISATKIRENLMDNWSFLHPIVQSYFALRICVLGAESTGTTTLSQALAEHYKTNWVPEFGRFYSESKVFNWSWETEEFEFIATEQNRIEDHLSIGANKVLICDTNSWVTNVWHNRYMNFYSEAVADISSEYRYSLYILTGDEIPFVQDGLRDGEAIRHEMHNTFLTKLRELDCNFIHVAGELQTRLESSISIIDLLITNSKF